MKRLLLYAFGAAALGLMHASPAAAHCDGLGGPVVIAAREALRSVAFIHFAERLYQAAHQPSYGHHPDATD